MKIIFLDFDGVMNPPNQIIQCKVINNNTVTARFGAVAVENLNYIIEKTNAYIVTSSNWRGCAAESKHLLSNNGIEARRVISVTPRIEPRGIRGKEIQAWLDNTKREIESYVILDDDDDMGELMGHLVQTKYMDALTRSDAERAIKILNGGTQ
jgi:hypothetical protein